MKKVLRFIGILLLVLVLIVVILGLIEPKDVTVERSMVINAPREAVWEQMVNFKNGPNWDPWYTADPSAKRDYFGTDGQPGSGYNWEGQKMGKGTMKDTAITGNKMSYALHFEKPWSGDASGFYNIEDNGQGGTKVTWNYYQHMPFPMNAMQAFMSMDKMMGNMFDSGLVKLKQYVESGKAGSGSSAGAGDVKEVQFPGAIYAGTRKVIAWNDMDKVYKETYDMLGKELGSKIAGPAADLVYKWDTVKHTADMAIVFPIKDTTAVSKKVSIFHVNASKADMGVLKGSYNGMQAMHGTINRYMASKGHKMGMVVEEYAVGPHDSQDSTKWVTNIYYLTQ